MRKLFLGVVLSFLLGAGTLVACSDDDSGGAKCGDGVMNGDEACDGADLGGQTCADRGYQGGTLACNDDCTFDESGCTSGSGCGNGVVDQGEECDGSDLNGQTCGDLGYQGGTLSCTANCQFDESGCTSGSDCGNGVVDQGEECDGSDLNGQTCGDLGYQGGTLSCTANCRFDESACTGASDCGNGVVDMGEECDGSDFANQTCADLGFQGGDLACNTDCTLNLSGCTGGCGNGVVEVGEDCDGDNLDNTTCADLGYDSGNLACNDQCLFDVSNCQGGGGGVGDPCVSNDDCSSGQCFPEVGQPDGQDPGVGLPGGYCVDACQQDGTCADPNAICVRSGLSRFCARACDLGSPQCRDGYGCLDIGNNQGICWGACTDDAQCTTTHDCDTDPDSNTNGFCLTPPEDCSNGVDDDFDNLADCADADCNSECPSGELCDNNTDDDGDGLVDCDDGECLIHPACTGISCSPDAALQCDDNLSGQSNQQANSTNTITDWCQQGLEQWTGPEYVWQLTVDANTIIHVGAHNLQADLDMIIMRDDGTQGCNPLVCYSGSFRIQPDEGDTEDATFEAQPGFTYYIAVDGWDGATSTFDLVVDCSPGEVCDDSQDNDGDGLVDCGDPSCFGQTGCTTEALCTDAMDNDADGDTDCADQDCSNDPYCSPSKTTLLEEHFDTWPPTGWTIEDGLSDGHTWGQDDGTARQVDNMDGTYALCDSDGAGRDATMLESLVSPAFDASGASHVWVEMDHYFRSLNDLDFGYVDVSTDGTNWTTVQTFADTDQGHSVIDLSAQAAGESNVQIRFRYEDGGSWAWYWAIDNVLVTSL